MGSSQCGAHGDPGPGDLGVREWPHLLRFIFNLQFFKNKYIYCHFEKHLFIYLAALVLSCGMWNLVP